MKTRSMPTNSGKKAVIAACLTSLTWAAQASACDPCALYSASRLQGHSEGALTLAVSEQYTDYDRPAGTPENSVRDGEFVRGYSTTQFSIAYDATQAFGLQFTLPLIVRRFDDTENFRTDTETDSGIGDLSLVGSYSFLSHRDPNLFLDAGFIGGLKFPTGDTGDLGDISNQVESTSERGLVLRHHQIGTASGGRALTFGSGSYDYILGLNLLTRYQRYLALSYAQYTIRTEGDFDYEYADDFLWSVSTGYYLYLGHDASLAALVALSGEHKGKDHLAGELVEGSQVSNLYLGPQLVFTLTERIGADVSWEFRLTDEDAGATVVPDHRLRAGFSYRFM